VTPERWQEVKKVLAVALEKAPAERAAYLDQACTDWSLRREVESLILSNEQGDSSFLEHPVVESPSGEKLKRGSRLGGYEILSRIGAGGMGVVYSAQDTMLCRTVALKILPEMFLNDPQRLARFQREARVLASLNHPHIATIFGLEQSTGTRALVMELVDGQTLAERIRQGPMPVDEALGIAKQICEALEYAHEHGVVHRDLKPANVKVTSGDAVKVLDFGLAKAIQGDGGETDPENSPTISAMATQAGMLLGTAAYMSPEQAKAKAADRRADIWAFGCVLYEMLTGTMAFGGASITETLASVIRAEPDWSLLPPGTPEQLRALLRRCLQKDVRQRLQAIGDARIALDEVLTGATEASAGPPSSPALWRRRLPWLLFGAAAAALAAFAWLYEAGGRRPVPAEPVRLQIPLPVKPPLRLTGLFVLSPDGRQLALAATSTDGIPRIWIRPLNSLELRPLAGTESVGSVLFWSPDSRLIAFDAGGKLHKINISGGPVETVCALDGEPVGGSWSNSGVMIFGLFGGPLMRVPASGGVATPLTVLDTAHGDVAHTEPQFLPDGTHFLYLRDTGTNGFMSVGSLNAKPEEQDSKRLVETEYGAAYVPSSSDPDSGQLVFLRGATLVAQPFDARHMQLSGEPVQIAEGKVGGYFDSGLFSVSANGTLVYLSSGNAESRPTWLDAEGKVLAAAGEPGPYSGLALSPDGTRAVVARFTQPENHWGIWLVDLSRGTSTRFAIAPDADNESPVWAPDGRGLIFGSALPGRVMDIVEKPLSGPQGAVVLFNSDSWKAPSSWSPDGRFVLFDNQGGGTKGDVWVLALGDHREAMPFLRTEFNEGGARFSPDGHWVAYASDESGRNEVYVRPFSPEAPAEAASGSGDKFLISNDGGQDPVWRRDGKELYYIDLNGKLMVVQTTTSGTAFKASAPGFVFQPPRSVPGAWSPSPDGKRFLFLVSETQEVVPFTVVLDWQAGLKK
jgi:eukaryotic-like serine/threonine-protein kinase